LKDDNKSNGKMGFNEGTYLRSSVVVVTESKTREGWERYCCSLQMIKLLSQRERERERERDVEKSNGQNSN
jgi:hypothetical protein